MTQSLALYCKHNMLPLMPQMANATQCNTRIGSDSIFASAALRLTNQFSEFYHNATDTTQGFVSLCEPSLRGKQY